MTRGKAIEIMQINRDGVANMSWSEDRTKTLAAFDMAIKALSQQTEYHGTEDMDGLYYCPICQQTTTVVKDGKCPKCGATMDELSTREQTEDAISRQAAIEKIHWLGLDNDTAIKCDLAIRALSSANTQEPNPEHWQKHTDASGNSWHTCPACGHIAYTLTRFCPDCGGRLEAPA